MTNCNDSWAIVGKVFVKGQPPMACDRLTPTAKCCRRFAAPPRPKKRNPRRARRGKELSTKGLEKAREGPAKDRQAEKEFPRKGKKISTKGHEERRRATKGLEEAREESAKGRKGGPRRDSKGLEKTRKGSVRGHEERHAVERRPPPRDLQELLTSMHRMQRIFQETALVILSIRKGDHCRASFSTKVILQVHWKKRLERGRFPPTVRGHEERHSGGNDLDLPGSAGVPPASGPRRRFRPRLRAREQTGNILYTINRKQGSVVSLLNDPPGRSGTRLNIYLASSGPGEICGFTGERVNRLTMFRRGSVYCEDVPVAAWTAGPMPFSDVPMDLPAHPVHAFLCRNLRERLHHPFAWRAANGLY